MLEITPCDNSVFCTLPLSSCALFPLSYSCSKTPNVLKMMNFFRHHFSSVCRGFFAFQHCGCRPRPAFPFATVSIISFILRADSAFSTAIFAFHSRPVIIESRSIWKSRASPNIYSSTSDNVGIFSFVDELYSTTFVKELGTPNHFL